MTAPTRPAPTRTRPTGAAAAAGPGRSLAGVWTLVRFMLRRDRIKLPAWALGIGVLVLYFSAALPMVYETESDLRGAVGLYADPVGRVFTGPGYGFDAPTHQQVIANGYGMYFLILTALMSILLVTRHTRVEEQTGRAELVHANVVGRHASLTAVLIVAAITNLAVIVAVTGAMVVSGFAAGGSVLFAAGLGATGLAFAGLSAVTVQLTEFSRAAAGMAGGLLGAAFVVRAGGDMAAVGGTAVSWTSPLAWAQQTAPFVLDRWWPLVLPLALAGVAAAVGYRLSARRDLGASLVAVRPGAAEAPTWLRSPLALALRLQRSAIIGWAASLAVLGLVFGVFADPMRAAVEEMPEAFLEIFGVEELVAGYLSFMAIFTALIVAIYAIQAARGLRSEEVSGRVEPVLATPVSRWAWLGSHLAVIAGAVVMLLAVTGLGMGIGAALVTGEAAHLWELTAAMLNQAPAVLVLLALGVLLFGVLPRAIAALWALVGYGYLVGMFGPLLDIPQAAANLSPFEHAARLPVEPFALTPVLVLIGIAVAGAAGGMVAFRRRGINVT